MWAYSYTQDTFTNKRGDIMLICASGHHRYVIIMHHIMMQHTVWTQTRGQLFTTTSHRKFNLAHGSVPSTKQPLCFFLVVQQAVVCNSSVRTLKKEKLSLVAKYCITFKQTL